MGATEAVIEGVLTEDRQLILDERPNLPAGRVKVLVRPAEWLADAQNSLLAAVRELAASQTARGYEGPPVSELLAELDAMRDEWDEGREHGRPPSGRLWRDPGGSVGDGVEAPTRTT